MKKKYSTFAFTIIVLSAVFSCHKPEKHRFDFNFTPQDSCYQLAQDSLFARPLFSRKLLLTEMNKPLRGDSFYWYMHYNLYVKTFVYTSELDSIVPLCTKTEQYCKSRPEMSPYEYYLMADLYNIIGNRYAVISQNDSAIHYFGRMSEYAQLIQHKTSMIRSYANLADVYTRSGRYTEGAHYFHLALLEANSQNCDPSEFILLYTGLGQTYMELRDYALANNFYDQAYALYDQMSLHDKFIYYNNRGNLKYFEEDYPAAQSLFQSGYTLVKGHTDFAYAQNLLKLNLGEICLLTGKLDSAQFYLTDSYGYFKAVGHESAVYHANTLMLELALREGNLTHASELLKQADETLSTEPRLVNIRKKYLQHYYETTGNYPKAYQYQKEYIQLDDSIRNDRIRMRVAEIDLRYKQDTTLMKQELFIQQQQSNMKSLEMSVFVWILVCALILLVAIFTYAFQKKQRAYLLVQMRNKMIGLRMENIRNRISPHFMFNVLNRVVSRYKETDSEYRDLHNLIKIMRLNLGLTEKLCLTLEEELDFVRTYLELEQQYFGTSLLTEINIAPEIDTTQFHLPSMMIQIPVENAIKHGLRNKEGDKSLQISIIKENGRIDICIEDNGSGFSITANRQNLQSTGTGLKVLNQTILLLNAVNSDPISFSISNRTGQNGEIAGCTVRFSIPEHYSYILPDNN